MDRERILAEVDRIRGVAEKGGYQLNPDAEFVETLVEGILMCRDRLGYDACPCRLATEDPEVDRAIVCPCIYRDADLAEYDSCYCGLYVTDDHQGEESPMVPDRWNAGEQEAPKEQPRHGFLEGQRVTSVPAHVCEVCGYTALLQDHPPRHCPVCGVTPDRFRTIRVLIAVPPD